MEANELRVKFIEYQRQFYNENEMYNLIWQSDQNRAILRGEYDDYINTIIHKL